MNYYEHHLGDYAQATAHLTFVEDAAYSRMLRKYYAEEKPLPVELRAVQRLVAARTDEEREAVEVVLAEFFTLESDGWHNKRADKVIQAYHGKQVDADAKRDNEAERQRRHRARRKELFDALRSYGEVPKFDTTMSDLEAMLSRVTDGVGHALLTEPVTRDATANQSPVTSHQTKSKELTTPNGVVVAGKPPTPDCPHSEIVALYHEILPELRRVREWTPDRQAFLRSRWREKPVRQNLDWWRKFFGYVRECPWLMGEGLAQEGRPPFTADLEWLVRPTNFRKVIEGKYQRRVA